MASEQLTKRHVDARCDVWALGVVLYEMVTGRKSFRCAPQVLSDAILHTRQEPSTAVRPDAPAELERIVNRALAKEPEKRYQTVTAMIADLQALQGATDSAKAAAQRPPESASAWRARALAFVSLAAIAAAWFWPRSVTELSDLVAEPLTF